MWHGKSTEEFGQSLMLFRMVGELTGFSVGCCLPSHIKLNSGRSPADGTTADKWTALHHCSNFDPTCFDKGVRRKGERERRRKHSNGFLARL